MLSRLMTAVAAFGLMSGAAQAKLTDPQIAHIAYTAGQIDIEAAKQALTKSKNQEVRAFADDMVRDHTAGNKQALALVDKLKVKPEDNATSQALTKQAEAKRTELAKLEGSAFDKAYVDNEVAYHRTVDSALETQLIPSASNGELKSLLPEDFPGPRTARPDGRCETEIADAAMMPRRILLFIVALSGPSSVSAQAADIQITIDRLVYAPADVSAKVGDTIEWVNKDALAHTATANNNDWDVMIGPNKTARLTRPGEVDYYCKFHPDMKGRLTVAD
jgi:putative membrane protein